MAKLIVLNQSLAGTKHELGESWVTIGRADDNLFQLNEASISGHHCEVKARGDELMVRDLRSTNGTFVGGQRVSEGAVKFGQTFRVGSVEMRFEASFSTIPKVSVIAPDTQMSVPPAVLPLPPKPVVDAADATPKYQVLFVDDSLAFLDSFATLCGELSGGKWQIHTAATADCALALLQHQPVDLAILDIGMPMLDGIQLQAIISRRYTNVKIAVLTGLASEENRTACLANGAELFLEKPSSAEGIRIAFNMLNDILVWTQQKGFSGSLQHVSLPDVIQLECLNRKSLILDVRNAQVRGQIFIEAGRIIHATTGNLTGEKAFQELIALAGGQFQLQTFRQPPERTVSGPWEFLLMEAARVRDEKTPPPAAPEPAKPELVKPEPAKTEPAKTELVKPEPVKPELAIPEPVKPELIKPEPTRPELVRPDENLTRSTMNGESIILMDEGEKTSHQASLADVIQLVCLNRESLILDVRNATGSGQIFIEAGRIIHATSGNQAGEGAFLELLALAGSQFQLQPFTQPLERSVSEQWEFLLMEAVQVHDEKTPVPVMAGSMQADEGPTRFVVRGENIVMAEEGEGKQAAHGGGPKNGA